MAKQPYLTKEQFIEYVDRIQKTCKKDDELSSAIEKACDDSSWCVGLYGAEVTTMVSLLSCAMGLNCDGQGYNDIEYFIYDLNFGKLYTKSCVTEADGTEIDISTVEKLYDYIVTCSKRG